MNTPLIQGEINGVKWRSLNPPQERIRSEEIERLAIIHQLDAETACLLFFDSSVSEHVLKPVNPIKYHNKISRIARYKYANR